MLDDPEVHLAVEVVGGVDWAKHAILTLLAAGKHVVTANKALLALHGAELFDAGRKHNRAIAFEAAVAGGVPIVAEVRRMKISPPTRSRASWVFSTEPAISS